MLIYKPSTQIPNAFHRNRIAEKLKIIKNDMTLFHVLLSTIDKLFTGKKSSCQFTDQFPLFSISNTAIESFFR